ncbi:unnamed protein product [Didymodactylos carnosus]|uniref:Uncharacterized protein n=1 Tax=Didymodactylos carnosus TaxID=1234261 RepID=A0A814ZAD4_9BILA|nr:unnamed protein product [Didymodactylos carnosus]CAF4006291.1 unnamed protein product [Didymodactylos carnosus]
MQRVRERLEINPNTPQFGSNENDLYTFERGFCQSTGSERRSPTSSINLSADQTRQMISNHSFMKVEKVLFTEKNNLSVKEYIDPLIQLHTSSDRVSNLRILDRSSSEIANLPVSSCKWISEQSGTGRDTIETPMGKLIVLYGDLCMAFMKYVRDTFETAVEYSAEHSIDIGKRFIKQLRHILQLDQSDNSTTIIQNMLNEDRQILRNYENKLIPVVYVKQIENNSELLQLLKEYVKYQWGQLQTWFRSFIDQQRNEAPELYDRILIRQAEYGKKYLNDCPYLSLAIQFLYELDENNIDKLNEIWHDLITDGRQAIRRHANYFIPQVLDEQLSSNTSGILLALKDYFRIPLTDILKEIQQADRNNLYSKIFDIMAEDGWRSINKCQSLLPPIKFKVLREQFEKRFSPNYLMNIRSTTSILFVTNPEQATTERLVLRDCVEKSSLRLTDLIQAGELNNE